MAQVILLERVDNLGDLGEVVSVKPGYARNYLIPQNKALRATKDNIAYFEAKKADIEKQNEANKKTAQTEAKKIEGLTVALIRLASESGQLFGSVNARDIAEVVEEKSGVKIARSAITIHEAFKTIGLFDVTIALHPEVKFDVTLNIARSEDEAKIQEETGKALVAEEDETLEQKVAEVEAQLDEDVSEKAKEDMLEEDALEAEKIKAEEDAIKDAEDAEKSAKKEAERKAKKEAKAAEEAAAAEAAEAEATEGEETSEESAESSEETAEDSDADETK